MQIKPFWVLLFSAVMGFFTCYYIEEAQLQQKQMWELSQRISESNSRLLHVQDEMERLQQFVRSNDGLQLEVKTVQTTGYAPLDPKAVAGMCFSGNPKITASGKRTTPGVTISASPEIPFGTWVWLEGLGWRRVDDRGSRIKGNRIDICFATRQEALKWGKRQLIMVMPHWNTSS